MTISPLYSRQTIICNVPQSSIELQTDSTTKTREIFQCPAYKGTYWEIGKKTTTKNIGYPFEHGEVIICESIHPVTREIGVLPNFTMRPMVTLKPSLIAVMG